MESDQKVDPRIDPLPASAYSDAVPRVKGGNGFHFSLRSAPTAPPADGVFSSPIAQRLVATAGRIRLASRAELPQLHAAREML